eukprot:TRINITY_DN13617_c0_g1_i2.p1 TRINITY_DN13617_c0_g1~~TRINITY_DN13617_c0_g1_i2.p1  ORF type:complete len:168 (-),score=10.67 TRINITY_DN13617_c0_g1_i2:60-563(-)
MYKSMFLFCFLGCLHATPLIKQKSPRFIFDNVSGGGNYQVGSLIDMSVRTSDEDHVDENDDWKFCTWTRADGEYCKFDYVCDGPLCDIGVGKFHHETVCSNGLKNRAQFAGEDPNLHNRRCGLQIPSAKREDSGTWRIEVEECRITGCGSNDGNDVMISTQITINVQ